MATPVGTGPIVQDVAPKGGFPKVSEPSAARPIFVSPPSTHITPACLHTEKRVELLVVFGAVPYYFHPSLLPELNKALRMEASMRRER